MRDARLLSERDSNRVACSPERPGLVCVRQRSLGAIGRFRRRDPAFAPAIPAICNSYPEDLSPQGAERSSPERTDLGNIGEARGRAYVKDSLRDTNAISELMVHLWTPLKKTGYRVGMTVDFVTSATGDTRTGHMGDQRNRVRESVSGRRLSGWGSGGCHSPALPRRSLRGHPLQDTKVSGLLRPKRLAC